MRLTRWDRERICNALMAHAFDARQAELKKQRMRIGDEIYGAIVGPHAKKMRSMPADWFSKGDSFEVKGGGRYFGTVEMSQVRILPLERITIDDHMELMKRLERICTEISKSDAERRDKSRETMNVLASFTTLEGLVDGWPEIRNVVPQEVLAGGNLPVPADIAKLTQDLGLGAAQRAN